MQVAGHTYPYRSLPLTAALDELVRLGLSLVELWLGHAPEGPESARAALRERGLVAAAVSAGGFYSPDSEAVSSAVDLAEALDAPALVACVPPELLDFVAERVPAGITLYLENHWDQAIARPSEMQAALGIGAGSAACLDTGHAILAGERPERFALALGSRLGHVHLKDAASPPLRDRLLGRRLRVRLLSRPEPVKPGEGALNVARFRRALDDVGYTGTVTVEYEGAEPTSALERLLDAWMSSETLASGV